MLICYVTIDNKHTPFSSFLLNPIALSMLSPFVFGLHSLIWFSLCLPESPSLSFAVISSHPQIVIYPRISGLHTPQRESRSIHGFRSESVLCLWQYSSSRSPDSTGSSACSSISPPAPDYIFYLDVTITTQISEHVSLHHLCFPSAIDVPVERRP